MSKLERFSNSFLRIGKHPFKTCTQTDKPRKNQHDFEHDAVDDTQACCCCHTDSEVYERFWPIIFFFSALTDFPMPLPKGKKPGQHREWGWMPVMVVIGLVAFVSYGYIDRIILVLLREKGRKAQSLIYIILFSIFIFFFVISYVRIVSQKPGHPETFFVDMEQSNDSSKDSSISAPQKPNSILGEVKWCKICQIWKPDRTHHCRVCNSCVLKMDHHCPWVNGCVGVLNYRYYLQFLFYVTLLAVWVFSTTLTAFIQFNSLSTFDGIALSILIISGIVTLFIGSFTLSHIWLTLINRTTIENSHFQSWKKAKKAGTLDGRLIEAFTESGRHVFNQGFQKNWCEVMGNNKLLWFVPLGSKQIISDGIRFGFSDAILKEYLNEDKSRRTKSFKNKPN